MTISTVPFALQNASHPAALFRQAVASLVPPNGGVVTAGDFAVTQTGTPSMAVVTGVGRAWIPGTEFAWVSGGNFSSQAMYYAENEAAYTSSITTSDATNPRIDLVYTNVNDQVYSGTLNQANIGVVTGTPNATPVAPALPNNAIPLAYVAVAANATSILNANITSLIGPPVSAASFARGLQTPFVTVTASTGSFTALTVVKNIPSFTFTGGRKYRIRWDFTYNGNTPGNYLTALIGTCSTSDSATLTTGITQLNGRPWKVEDASINTSGSVEAIYMPGATTTLQLKFLAQVTTGSGTIVISASTLQPAFYLIEDIGAQF